jgi:hypothetical protein
MLKCVTLPTTGGFGLSKLTLNLIKKIKTSEIETLTINLKNALSSNQEKTFSFL